MTLEQSSKPGSRLEGKKHPSEMLKEKLAVHSRETNQIIEAKYGVKKLLAGDGSLKKEGYKELYGEESMKEDAKTVRNCELKFSSATDPGVKQYFLEQYGAKNEDEIIAQWRENKLQQKNGQMEMAVTLLLSEKLGKDFLVVRTASIDDYVNGVDNLIVDLKTGEVVGAFDEVHKADRPVVDRPDRAEGKKEKIEDVARSGGVEIKYGLKLIDGKLSRANLKGVPVFYLSLESEDLISLMDGLGTNDVAKTDKIFEKLLNSLEDQHKTLSGIAKAPIFKARLASFEKSLKSIKTTR